MASYEEFKAFIDEGINRKMFITVYPYYAESKNYSRIKIINTDIVCIKNPKRLDSKHLAYDIDEYTFSIEFYRIGDNYPSTFNEIIDSLPENVLDYFLFNIDLV